MNYTQEQLENTAQRLTGTKLAYAEKNADNESFDFGFGETAGKDFTYALHVTCSFDVIPRDEALEAGERVRVFGYDASAAEFQNYISAFFGKEIIRVAVNEKNDLWLDLGDYWVVFDTDEYSDDEAWRLTETASGAPALIASGMELRAE